MNRIDRATLSSHIFVTIQCMPKTARRATRDILPSEEAIRILTDKLLDYLDSSVHGVFQTAPYAGIPFGNMERDDGLVRVPTLTTEMLDREKEESHPGTIPDSTP